LSGGYLVRQDYGKERKKKHIFFYYICVEENSEWQDELRDNSEMKQISAYKPTKHHFL
jgi:hypothetical protein